MREASFIAVVFGWLAALALSSSSPVAANDRDDPSASHIGSAACKVCHTREFAAWRGSHHDLAMQPASEASVLGDFGDVTFDENGVRSRFFRRGSKFMVNTEGPDGNPADFEIAFTFGFSPLQQYLVAFPGGRYQVLGSSWDTRPKESGGQRWFSNYANESIHADDVLHWTKPSQNWNHVCADCHSTNLRKGYDAATDSFDTRWSEIDVACEACHGPGSKHRAAMVEWSRNRTGREQDASKRPTPGLKIEFPSVSRARWSTRSDTGLPFREPRRTEHNEVELCARCHSRRSTLVEAPEVGLPLHDTHRVSPLIAPVYHSDGQPRPEEEGYVYGSFVQSAMYRAGVTCSDCHDPHSATLRATGNDLCGRCHTPERYDVPKHHHHEKASVGAQCVECHMPNTTYMRVDERRDHSIRVPRPDLSETLGAPNACNRCHGSMTSGWAAQKIATWFPNGRQTTPHWGEAIHAGRWSAVDAERQLVGVLANPATPAIVRATAIGLLPAHASQNSLPAFLLATDDDNAMVRTAALEAIGPFPAPLRQEWATKALDDPIRSVRFEAVRDLVSIPPEQLGVEPAKKLETRLAEFRTSLMRNADRPESHTQLAELALAEDDLDQAEREYRIAIERNPSFIPAYINLADLYRVRESDEQAEKVLREALTRSGDHPDVHHALGLVLIRRGHLEDATRQLEMAAVGRPENPRYAYVYAAALHEQGRADRALAVLRDALAVHPGDRDLRAFAANLERAKK